MKERNWLSNRDYPAHDLEIDIAKPLAFTDNKMNATGWVPMVTAGGHKPYPLKGIIYNEKKRGGLGYAMD